MRYRFCRKMRVAEDRVRFYGIDGMADFRYRPLNRNLTKPHSATFVEHTCKLTAEERLLRAIFAEDDPPCCDAKEKTEVLSPAFVASRIRRTNTVSCRKCGKLLTTGNAGRLTADRLGCELLEPVCWNCEGHNPEDE